MPDGGDLTQEFIDAVEQRLRELDIPQAELARRLGVARSQITLVLNSRNPTLRTVVDYGRALGVRFHLTFEPVEEVSGD